MRALPVILAVSLLFGCASPRKSVPYGDDIRAIRAAAVSLPASPQRSEILSLIGEFQKRLEKDLAFSESHELIEEAERLQSFAESIMPTSMELGFATCFKDWTKDGAYDGVEVIITPLDKSSSAVKAPGSAEVSLYSSGFLGARKLIDRWEIRPGLMANSWNDRLFPGYIVRLEWTNAEPEEENCILEVAFTPLAGGEALTASTLIRK
jgi:hypothetical protein